MTTNGFTLWLAPFGFIYKKFNIWKSGILIM